MEIREISDVLQWCVEVYETPLCKDLLKLVRLHFHLSSPLRQAFVIIRRKGVILGT